jgi:hypothetical protein
MTLVALIICLLIAAVGALGVISPSRLLGVLRHAQSRAGLYAGSAVRVVLGVALFLASPTSRAPELIRILGVVLIVAGLITPFIGLKRFRRLLDWFQAQGSAFVRVWAIVALALGLSLAYAVTGR